MTRYRVAITRDGSPDGYVYASKFGSSPERPYEASILKNAEAMRDSMQKRHDDSHTYLTSKGENPGPVLAYTVEEQ